MIVFSWRRGTTRPPRRSGRPSWRRRHGRRMSRGYTGKGGSVAGQRKRRCKSGWEGRRGRQGSVCLPDSVLSPIPCWQWPCGHLRTSQLPSALALTSCHNLGTIRVGLDGGRPSAFLLESSSSSPKESKELSKGTQPPVVGGGGVPWPNLVLQIFVQHSSPPSALAVVEVWDG